MEIQLTLHVMWDGLRGAARDAADQIDRLNAWLTKCAGPAAQRFSEQMVALAKGLRPPGTPPASMHPAELTWQAPSSMSP
jgi:hypothetical protein